MIFGSRKAISLQCQFCEIDYVLSKKHFSRLMFSVKCCSLFLVKDADYLTHPFYGKKKKKKICLG